MSTTRVTADFDENAYKALTEVADEMGTTKVDAIRRALGLIRYVLRQKKDQKKFMIEDEKGKERVEIVTF